MQKYLAKRVLEAIGVIFAISLITFFVLNIVPGNPVELMLGEMANQETIDRVTHEMGLDQPIPVQYVNWLTNMLKGDFGTSYFQRKPVLTLLGDAFAVTAKLALFAYILAMILGVGIGVLAAINNGNVIDRALMVVAVTGVSAPSFWIAIILQIFIGLKWGVLPISGVGSWQAYILPSLALGSRYAASTARVTRTAMLEVISQDYIRTAQAKGSSYWAVVIKHALRNALIPVITVAGADLGSILTGSMLIESVFTIPGIGMLLVSSINTRDLPLVQGGVMYIAVICVVVYLVVDILYAVVDPRIRLGEEAS